MELQVTADKINPDKMVDLKINSLLNIRLMYPLQGQTLNGIKSV